MPPFPQSLDHNYNGSIILRCTLQPHSELLSVLLSDFTTIQNTDSLSFVCHETFSQKSKGLNGKDSFHVKKGFQNKYSESLEMFFVSICPSLHLPLSVFLSLSNLYSHNNAL